MSTDDEKHPKRDGVVLSRDVQEHLGRKLRTELRAEADKPSYLGESSVPAQFAPLVRRLEAGERGERQGYEAVKRAIIDLPFEAPDEPVREVPPD